MKYLLYGFCIYIIYEFFKDEVFIKELFKFHECKN